MKILFIFLSGLSFAAAACPNNCSGHGSCGLGDICSCQPKWGGSDCNSRQCPHGLSWVTSKDLSHAPSGTTDVVIEGTLGADATTLDHTVCGGPVGCEERDANCTLTCSWDGVGGTCSGDDTGCADFLSEASCTATSCITPPPDSEAKLLLELEQRHQNIDFGGYQIQFLSYYSQKTFPPDGPTAYANSGGIWSQNFVIDGKYISAGEHQLMLPKLTNDDFADPGPNELFSNQSYKKGDHYRITTGTASLRKTSISGIQGTLTGKHPYTECSSKGSCDRTTGECQCYEGYEGRGCTRQTCPDNCSGHGRCVDNKQVNSMYGPTEMHPNEQITQYWDYKMSRQCICDRGWQGYACEDRMCPRGADPLGNCAASAHPDISDIQLLIFEKVEATGFVTLSFEAFDKGVYETAPIRIYKSGHEAPEADYNEDASTDPNVNAEPYYIAKNIEHALENLPNFIMPNVTVTPRRISGNPVGDVPGKDYPGTAGQQAWALSDGNIGYYITFVDAANSGLQNLIKCSKMSGVDQQSIYNSPAHQPRFEEAKGSEEKPACYAQHFAQETYSTQNNYHGFVQESSFVCANRGHCDHATGLCTCFEGFSGEACASQTIFF